MSEFDPLEDIGDDLANLLKNGFPSSIFQVKTETNANGLQIKSKFATRKSNETKGTLCMELPLEDLNMTIKGKLNTENAAKLGVEFADLGLQNSSLDLSLAQSIDLEKKLSVTDLNGEWKYQKDQFGVKLAAVYDCEKRNPPSFEAQVVVQKPENIYWSVKGTSSNEEGSDKITGADVNASVTHRTLRSEATFDVNYEKNSSEITLTGNWLQKLRPNLTYGATFSSSVDSERFSTSAAAVAQYEVDASTTIRAKTTTKNEEGKAATLRFGFGYSQRISERCVATVGADFNARHLFNSGAVDGKPHSIGFEVQLS
jgi:hypothetical protein